MIDGKWEATWTVVNSEADLEGKIVAVTPATVEGIAVDATLPKSGDGALTGKQIVTGGDEAVLKVTVRWVRDGRIIEATKKGVAKPSRKCAAAGFEAECDGSVVVTLDNTTGSRATKLTVTAKDFEETHEVLGNVLLVLAAVHVLAGLKHQFVDRDGVLGRMLAG